MPYFSMAGTVLRNLFSKPATRRYPTMARSYYANTRGRIAIDIGACIFCGLCQRRCPTDAITVSKPDRSWAIDRLRCIQCSACVEVCPKKCLGMENRYSPSTTTREQPDLFTQSEKTPPPPSQPPN